MRLLFVMDPLSSMLPDKDTSFAFMRAALQCGHEILHCEPAHVSIDLHDVTARARPVTLHEKAPHATGGSAEVVNISELSAVLIRKDPPFDTNYQHLTQQLDLVKDRVLVVNDPAALRDANEKLFAFQFKQLMPRTLVSADPERLIDFAGQVGGKAVLKPLDGAGGSGVVILDVMDRNRRALVDLMTREGRELTLLQEFQPAVFEGDKRVLVLDGAPLGAILRVPQADDFRANIHVGGRVEATELSQREEQLVKHVGERLRAMGLYFVGLDLIGERLIEVNVTSPTGIQELGRLTQTQPELDFIRWLEQKVAEAR